MSVRRTVTAIALASMVSVQVAPAIAHAENAMGYRLVSTDQAARLPNNRGALGVDVAPAKQITDSGMTFDLMEVRRVKAGSAGEAAGLQRGDEIIAVNGRVFPSGNAFAMYLRSIRPGSRVTIDYIPAGRGPANAERVSLVMGTGNQTQNAQTQAHSGMSTRTKIGLGAAAILGCYYMGCFSGSGSSAR
jgi:C-terminal processing protease CtpA/Prc